MLPVPLVQNLWNDSRKLRCWRLGPYVLLLSRRGRNLRRCDLVGENRLLCVCSPGIHWDSIPPHLSCSPLPAPPANLSLSLSASWTAWHEQPTHPCVLHCDFCLVKGIWGFWYVSISDLVDVVNHPLDTMLHIFQELIFLINFFLFPWHGATMWPWKRNIVHTLAQPGTHIVIFNM